MGFQFTPEHISAIVRGDKIMTRRPRKERERIEYGILPDYDTGERKILAVLSANAGNGRLKWQVGRDYAVCPGRGKPGVWWQPGLPEWIEPGPDQHLHGIGYCGYFPLRIRILAIRQELLGDISPEDCIREGIIYDGACYRSFVDQPGDCISDARSAYQRVWTFINGPRSWKSGFLVWPITFEVVNAQKT